MSINSTIQAVLMESQMASKARALKYALETASREELSAAAEFCGAVHRAAEAAAGDNDIVHSSCIPLTAKLLMTTCIELMHAAPEEDK